MWKQTTPEPDSGARLGGITSARTQGACDDDHPTFGGGKVRVTPLEGLSDEVNLNDAWLVEHARHGDHQAFAVLVRRYERKLIRVLARLVRDPEQARDLAQETFWRVYSRL